VLSLSQLNNIAVELAVFQYNSDSKGKAVQLQSWTVPDGSGKLRFPDFVTTAQVVSLTHRPPLLPLLEAESTPGP